MSMLREDARRAYSAHRERAAMNAAVVLSLVPIGVIIALAVPPLLLPLVPAAAAAVAALLLVALLARRSLANILAGLTLLVVQPYEPGEKIRLYASSLDEVVDAELLHVGLLRTTLCSKGGVVEVPNARLLRSAPDQRAA